MFSGMKKLRAAFLALAITGCPLTADAYSFAVYPGCAVPPPQPTGKKWYFAPVGATSPYQTNLGTNLSSTTTAGWATYFAANPTDTGTAGDSAHPFDNPSAVYEVGTGYSKPLAAMAGYTHGSIKNAQGWTTYADYSTYAPSSDTTRIWPGDAVVLESGNYGGLSLTSAVFSTVNSAGSKSFYNWPIINTNGTISYNAVQTSTLGTFSSWSTPWSGQVTPIWFMADPAQNAKPIFTTINSVAVIGVVLEGINVLSVAPYATSTAGYFWLITTNPSPGTVITLNGVAWTFVASGATGNQINIGATTGATVTNAAAAWTASTDPKMTVMHFAANGNYLEVAANVVGQSGTYPVSTVPLLPFQTTNGPTLPHLYTGATEGQAAKFSGNLVVPSHDIIIDNMSEASWDPTRPYVLNDYPTTGSIGIGGTPGGAWNAQDFASQALGGLVFTGVYTADGSNTPAGGLYCVGVSNSMFRWLYGPVGISSVYNVAFTNLKVDYQAGDAFDVYGAYNVNFKNVDVNNQVDAETGLHNDGIQLSGNGPGGNSGYWGPVSIHNYHEYANQDPQMAANGISDGFDSGILVTNVSWHDLDIEDSVIVINAQNAIKLVTAHSFIANNTALWAGAQFTGGVNGGAMIDINTPTQAGAKNGSVVINNVSNGIGDGNSTVGGCTSGVFYAGNYAIPAVSVGGLYNHLAPAGYLCTSAGALVASNGAGSGTYNNGGVTVDFTTPLNSIFKVWNPPTTGEPFSLTTTDPRPANWGSTPTGPLTTLGAAFSGAPLYNTEGDLFPVPPRVGAY